MSSKKSALPRFEFILIIVFFFSFVIWAVSRCNSTKAKDQQAVEEEFVPETPPIASTAAKDSVAAKPAPRPRASVEQIRPLYVTFEGMNLRASPDVNGKRLARLKLFEEVSFLDEVTDFKEEIEIGSRIFNEPWIKVKNQKGQEGWMYGAGLNYYKTKLDVGE
ncbi:MAG: SH3 domain-containing protein [Bacteroidota bacterium]